MMYLALTYDHRLLDGREAVTFLIKVFHPSLSGLQATTDSVTGQGVHRGPAPHAPWMNDSTVATLMCDPCSWCLELPLARCVDYQISRYNCLFMIFSLPCFALDRLPHIARPPLALHCSMLY